MMTAKIPGWVTQQVICEDLEKNTISVALRVRCVKAGGRGDSGPLDQVTN